MENVCTQRKMYARCIVYFSKWQVGNIAAKTADVCVIFGQIANKKSETDESKRNSIAPRLEP